MKVTTCDLSVNITQTCKQYGIEPKLHSLYWQLLISFLRHLKVNLASIIVSFTSVNVVILVAMLIPLLTWLTNLKDLETFSFWAICVCFFHNFLHAKISALWRSFFSGLQSTITSLLVMAWSKISLSKYQTGLNGWEEIESAHQVLKLTD